MISADFLREASARGFVQQLTHPEALETALQRGSISAYIGFDCTAPSLHVGSLMQIMLLRLLQRTGHRPVVLVGGGTTKVGDPSGKDESRKLLGADDIEQNKRGILGVLKQFIAFEGSGGNAVLVDNADWLDGLNYLEFLRDYGRHFSINRMLTMESVRLRLEREQNLSFLEFNYMILQAYDFVKLHELYGCRLQIGGSDQWGNIVSGIELHRRLHSDNDASHKTQALFGLTTPLITTASGGKMGKTAKGAIWLKEELFPAFEYWQFWRNCDDADVRRFLCYFTELPLDEIGRLSALQGAELNEAKKILATEATTLCHGPRTAQQAAETARRLFEEKSASSLEAGGLPSVTLPAALFAGVGITATDLYVASGMRPSKGEARKLIEGGGGRLGDMLITDPKMLVTLKDFSGPGRILKLGAGKKQSLKVTLAE